MKQIGGRRQILVLITITFLVLGLVYGGYLLYKYKFNADTVPASEDNNNILVNGGFESNINGDTD